MPDRYVVNLPISSHNGDEVILDEKSPVVIESSRIVCHGRCVLCDFYVSNLLVGVDCHAVTLRKKEGSADTHPFAYKVYTGVIPVAKA